MKVVIQASQKLQLILQEAEWGGGKRIGPGHWGPGSQFQPAANSCSPALGKSPQHPDLIFLPCQEREIRSLPFKQSMILWEAASSDNIKEEKKKRISSYGWCHHQKIVLSKCVLNS